MKVELIWLVYYKEGRVENHVGIVAESAHDALEKFRVFRKAVIFEDPDISSVRRLPWKVITNG